LAGIFLGRECLRPGFDPGVFFEVIDLRLNHDFADVNFNALMGPMKSILSGLYKKGAFKSARF
jgi:hypothetical protein